MTLRPCAFVLYAWVPRHGAVKTRMVPHLDLDEALALHVALVEDSLDLLRAAAARTGGSPFLALSEPWKPPPDGPARSLSRAIGEIALLPQRGGDLGDRLRHTCDDLFERRHRGVVVIGSDSPTLPPDRLVQALTALQQGADAVVGPSEDGGYYLIGVARNLPGLFEGVAWGTRTVYADTVATARRLRLRTEILPPWYDIDRPEDLARLHRETRGRPAGAARTIAIAAALAQRGRLGN
jgi:rSAM/selenodomain-associated transferase 1